MRADFLEAQDWAKDLIYKNKFFILDVETTGFGDAEIVDICVMNSRRQPLLNTLVKPTIAIPPEATSIHGVTNEMVADAPTFPDIYPRLKQLIEGKLVIIYNKQFDCHIIDYCCQLHDLKLIEYTAECAMLWYAQYYGQWNEYYEDYTWQKLPGGGGHRALSDCGAVLDLLCSMGTGDDR